MDNNNDNNLFTNMFGVESEEIPTTEPPQKVEQPTFEQPLQQTTFNQQTFEQPTVPQSQPVTFNSMQPDIQNIVTPIQPQEEEMVYLDSTPKIEPPISTPQIPLEQPVTNNTQNEINYADAEKPSPALIIILIVIMIGGGLYMAITTFSSPKPQAPKQPETEQPTTVVTDKEESKEEEKPTAPAVTTFDVSLTFEKGYTTNTKELNQTISYQPEQTEGVIKCETIKNKNIDGGVSNKEIVYMYYKDAAVKKIITISDAKYSTQSLYNTYLKSFKSLKTQATKYNNLVVDYKGNNSTKTINAKVYVDLVYGHNFKFDDTKYIYRIGLSYNTPIKAAMDKLFFNQDYQNNLKCSTLITN